MNEELDCLVIGAGPCGILFSVKLMEKGVRVALFDGGMPGGKVNTAPRVDNYPGYHEISGPDLAMEFYRKLLESGAELVPENVLSLRTENGRPVVETESGTYRPKTVFIASGTREKKLELPNEDALFGHGLSYCAVCDGHFFRGRKAILVGSDDSAVKEAIYLSGLVSELYVVNGSGFTGIRKYADILTKKENVRILQGYEAVALNGTDHFESLTVRNRETGETRELQAAAVFPIVGEIPNTSFIRIPGLTDDHGTIPVDPKTMRTNAGHVYAGGDVLPRDIRQIYLAELDADKAAIAVLKELRK